MTLKMIGRMIIGKAAIQNLSGPISIAQYAGQSASLGLIQFLKFLAVVSVSLAVLNLLPIPVLDGGHLMFYVIEAVKGSPVSEQTQALCQQIGVFILLSLMALAFFLDIERLLA
jgi:regulator of sigma E protease